MTLSPDDQVTRLLGQLGRGERGAVDELLPLVYGELRKLAGSAMRDARPGHTLQPTAVLHEAYVRLVGERAPEYENRVHFLGVAARAMRSVLVDHARRSGARKRPSSARRVELTDNVAGYEERGLDLLALDEAIEQLGRADARLVRVVELLFFGGLTAAEAGEVLGCSARTVERDWRAAKAYLHTALDSSGPVC